MRKTNKRSEGYQTRAERKKQKNEIKRNLRMEKKILIGLYDDYRTSGTLNELLKNPSCKLMGSYWSEPNYTMYDLKNEDNCGVVSSGNHSILIEVWEVSESYLDKIEKSYNYYAAYAEYPQDYSQEKVMSPFGETLMYFIEDIKDDDEIIIDGDWIENLNYKSATLKL